ncbi:MAG: hypothetical protein OXF68_16255 [Gammaproteobacteria bacterium]|nr:hypothetical protein [Gammaproteobacteria bacterium]MCY4343774.1 hypothetical protein [Gammaproteobacteria bacterium]
MSERGHADSLHYAWDFSVAELRRLAMIEQATRAIPARHLADSNVAC